MLSEDDIRIIKGLVRETLYEILEAEFYGGLFRIVGCCGRWDCSV